VWMTGTDAALFSTVGEATRLRVADGVVTA